MTYLTCELRVCVDTPIKARASIELVLLFDVHVNDLL